MERKTQQRADTKKMHRTAPLSLVIKQWGLPGTLTYELARFCNPLRQTTTVQVAGSGVILLSQVFDNLASLRAAVDSSLGAGLYQIFTDVQLTTKLDTTICSKELPARVYVLVDGLAKQRRQLEEWLLDPPLTGPGAIAIDEVTTIVKAKGPIPTAIRLLRNVEDFRPIFCDLNGPLPSAVFQLSAMHVLYVTGCHLSGRIPSEIGTLLSLKEVYLDDNPFTGPIPTEIGNLTELKILYLGGSFMDDRHLTGPVPTTVGRLCKLHRLALLDTSLTGQVPTEICLLKEVYHLEFRGHRLSGYPPAMELLPNIVDFIYE